MLNSNLIRRAAVRCLRASFLTSDSLNTPPPARRERFTDIECLESRIAPAQVLPSLPSLAIGDGLHKTAVSFTDADGDLVKVTLAGGGHFDIKLDGLTKSFSDIDNINITDAKASSVLTVTVTSKVASGGTVTPGFTNINSITSSFAGTIKSINLNSAEVQDINLGSVKLRGGLTLDVTKAAKADMMNQRAANKLGMTYTAITPGLDFNNVTLDSADSITIRGSATTDAQLANDFDGAIVVTNGLNKLIGTRSSLNGSLSAGTLGGVVVAHLNGGLNTTGDMTLDVRELDANAFVTVGGDLNLRLGYAGASAVSGSGLYGHVSVAGNVSGLAKGSLDAVNVRGNFAGILNAGGDVASVVLVSGAGAGNMQLDNGVSNGQFTGTLTAGGNIGNISAQQGYSSSAFIASNGSIGDISSLGTNSGTFAADGSIGKIVANVMAPGRAALAGASFNGQEGIGTITATSFNGVAVTDSTFESESGDIGETMARVTNLTGGDAIHGVTYSAPSGTVNDIGGFSAGANGIVDLHVNAVQVRDVAGVAGPSSHGTGFSDSTVTALDSIGDVAGVALGSKGIDGLARVTLLVEGSNFPNFGRSFGFSKEGGTIGNISGHTGGSGSGITELNATAPSHIGDVEGTADTRGHSGISDSHLTTNGSIASLTGTTDGMGDGLSKTSVNTGYIGAIRGAASGTASGNGIASIIVNAGNIESISGSASHRGGSGISESSFSAYSIGTVDASGGYNGSAAIDSSDIFASQIGLITANGSYGILGGHIGNGSYSFHYEGISSNSTVNTSIDTTGGRGSIGSINIGGDFIGATLGGVHTLQSFSVSGAVTGTVGNSFVNEINPNDHSLVASTIHVGDEAHSDVTFQFQEYQGSPAAYTGYGSNSGPREVGYSSGNITLTGVPVVA